MVATVFAIGGIIFFILGVAVSSVMVNTAKPVACAPTEVLRRDEQTLCRPSTKKDYIAKTDSNAVSFINYYRLTRSRLSNTVHRVRAWNGTVDLSKGAYSFPVTSSVGMKLTVNVKCDSGKCETVKVFWLRHDYFNNANKSGTFNEGMYSCRQRDLSKPLLITEMLDESILYYLVFGNQNDPAILQYSITIDYTVYSLNELDRVNCSKQDCEFRDVGTDEIIVMDYIDTNNKGPAVIGAEIKSAASSYGGAVFFGILFVFLSLACFAVCVLFILHKTGKINLYRKKAALDTSGSTGGSYKAPEVAAEDTVRVSGGVDDEL